MSTSEKSDHKENSRAALKLPKGITRCTNGRFQARYTSNGHRYSLYGWDLEELERRLKEAKEESLHKECVNSGRIGRADTEEAQGGMALDEWYEIWLREYKAVSVKQGTVDSYRCIYEYYIRPELGQMCLTRIKGQDLQMFYNNMSRQGYSKATMSLTSVVLGSMLSQAFKNELIPKNPALLCTLPRNSLKKAEKAVLTQEQQEILMQYAKKSPLEGIIMLALGTGMRIGEITALEWKDIDFTKMELTVSGTLKQRRSDNTFYKDVPKTEHSRRSIPLLPEMVRVLKMQKAKQKEQRKASGSLWEPVKGLESLVFLRKDGTPVSGQYIRQQLKHLIDEINGNASSAAKRRNGAKKRAVMPYFTPHALRHTFATRAIEKGIPPKVVQELLGHSSITITLDLYTHVLPETKAEEIKKLEKLY